MARKKHRKSRGVAPGKGLGRTMAYHRACYAKATGRETSRVGTASYSSSCSYCGGTIAIGDKFCWVSRGANAGGTKVETRTNGLIAPSGYIIEAKAEVISPPEESKDIVDTSPISESSPSVQESKPGEELSFGFGINVKSLAKALLPHLEGKLAPKNQETNGGITYTVNVVEVKKLDIPENLDMGVQHHMFPTLLKALSAKVNVWLAGPSGSGKTTACVHAAKALGLKFFYTGAVGDAYALIGYNDANGRYVRTPFREAWENGGLFLWDEVDASDPNALLAFNAALANGSMSFPDGMIPRHPDCVLVAAANTYGHGGTHEYVGRLKLDGAFLKRFAFISWEYDEALEMATCSNKDWVKRVQSIRAKVKARGLRVLVTPRESYIGAQLLSAGLEQSMVEEMTVKSGMTKEQWDQVR